MNFLPEPQTKRKSLVMWLPWQLLVLEKGRERGREEPEGRGHLLGVGDEVEGKFPFQMAGKLALASGQSEGRRPTLQVGGWSAGDAWPLLLAL